jgi:hypothetical protein
MLKHPFKRGLMWANLLQGFSGISASLCLPSR